MSKIAVVGEPVVFSTAVTGEAPVAYQWKHNGTTLTSATTASLNIPSASLADRGWYLVTASNATGVATSVFVLEVGLANSTLVHWSNSPAPPSDLGSVMVLKPGGAAIRGDGTVAVWGRTADQQAIVPAGLANVVDFGLTSDGSVALKSDGSVVTGGTFASPPPVNLANIVSVSAGWQHVLALKADGTVLAWGANGSGQLNVPAGLRDVVSVSAGASHSAVLKADGTVAVWGDYGSGVTYVPANLTNAVALTSGSHHMLALRADGTLAAWGLDYAGVTDIPAGLSQVTSVVAGDLHAVALRADGTVVAWGRPYENQTALPPGLSGVTAIAPVDALLANASPVIESQPVSRSVVSNDYVVLSVAARGTIPLAYTWKRNGVEVANGGRISGSTTATLVFDGITTADAGDYRVEVMNAFGSALSAPATLAVAVPPTLTARPLSRMVALGQPVTLTVATSDPGAISYQWKRNGQPIAGATGAILTLPAATMSDRGFYEVVVSNGVAALTSVLQLGVSPSPASGTIIIPWGIPASDYGQASIPDGLASAVATSAAENHAAALKADGTVVAWGLASSGATTVPAGLGEVVAIAAGSYFVAALRADGRVVSWGKNYSTPLSLPADLRGVVAISAKGTHFMALRSDGMVVSNYFPPPAGLAGVVAIAAGAGHCLAMKRDGTVVAWTAGSDSNRFGEANVPVGLGGVTAIGAGDHHSLAVRSDGTVVCWGDNAGGQATPPPGLKNVVAVDGGYLHSIALRSDGTVTGWGRDNEKEVSDALRFGGVASLTAGSYNNLVMAAATAPLILQAPGSRTANSGDTVVLAAPVTAAPLASLQWKKDGVTIAGASANSLTLVNVQAANAGRYTLTATNSLGTATSPETVLTVVPPLAITARPLSKRINVGQSASLSLAATGAVTYQWRHNGAVIAGATGSTLNLVWTTLADAGFYEVIATGGNGATGRAVAHLLVGSNPAYVVGWQVDGTPIAGMPADLTDVLAISAHGGNAAALRANGTVTIWNSSGVSSMTAPSGIVGLAAGASHVVALKADGTVAVSGSSGYGEADVPAGLASVVAVAASGYNSMALRNDGTVVRWGYDYHGQGAVPAGLTNVVAIAAAASRGVALQSGGSATMWGFYESYSARAPLEFGDVVALAAVDDVTLFVQRDGRVGAWGGQGNPPINLASVRQVSGGDPFLALKVDGTIAAWRAGSTEPVLPAGLANVVGIAAGSGRSYALIEGTAVAPVITTQPLAQTADYDRKVTLSVVATGTPVLTYQWKKNGIAISGATTTKLTLDHVQSSDAAIYSVTVTNAFGSTTSAGAALAVQANTVSAAGVPTVGGAVALSTNASGVSSFQWRYRGTPLAGATQSTLTLSGLSRGQNGDYDVVLTTAAGTKVAQAYRLDVAPLTMPDLFAADVGFSPRLEAAGAATFFAVLKLPDGKFLVGGDFSRLGDTPVLFLARLHPDGTVDPTYSPPVLSGPVRALATNAEGKIYVAGNFSFVDGHRSGGLMRLTAALAVDVAFPVGQGFDGSVFALAVQPDGKVIVGGDFAYYGSAYATRAVRLNTDATLDPTFGYNNSIGPVRAIQLQPDGKVLLAGGTFSTPTSTPAGYILRVMPSGGNDWTFGPSSSSSRREYSYPICALARLPDGRWLAGGGAGNVGSCVLERLTADGILDPTFVFDRAVQSTAAQLDFLAMQGDGKVLLSGSPLALCRLTATGARDNTLPPVPVASGRVGGMTAEADGTLRLWGTFTAVPGGEGRAGSLRLSLGGDVLAAGPLVAMRAPAAVFDAQNVTGNKVLVRGAFTHVNDIPRTGLARLTAEGVVDATFNSGPNVSTTDTGRFVLTGDGGMLVHNGIQLVRLRPDGTLDPTFSPFSYVPSALALDHEGRVLVSNGGSGGTFGATSGMRRLSATGALDLDFVVTGEIRDMVVQASGWIVVAGNVVNGSLSGLARLYPDGSLDPRFPAMSGGSFRVRAANNDRVFVTAPSSTFPSNPEIAESIVRLDPLGGDDGFSYQRFDQNYPGMLAWLELPNRKVLRASVGGAAYVSSNTHLLGRHLVTGAPDVAFQCDGVDPLRSYIERCLLMDDGNLWLFGRDLAVMGAPRFGVLRLTPATAASVTSPPVSVQAAPGGSATFAVVAAGSAPITYQWYRDGMKLAGATNATLTLSNLTPLAVGKYTVRVGNTYGAVTPAPVTITGPNPAPTVTTSPTSQTANAGQPAVLSVSATGVGALTYQWRKFGYALPGATNPTLTLPHAVRSDAGIYDVLVADGLSITISAGARLDVAPSSYPNKLDLDASFGPSFETNDTAVGLKAAAPGQGGKILVSGAFTRVNGVARGRLARLNADGSLDPTFDVGSGFDVAPVNLLELPDGRWMAGGPFTQYNGTAVRTLVRLLANGSLDPTFAAEPDSNGRIYDGSLTQLRDGRVLVDGFRVYLADGTLDTGFSPAYTGSAGAVALADGGMMVGDSTASARVARLQANGSLVATGLANVSRFASIAVQPDGKVLVGGGIKGVSTPFYPTQVGRLNAALTTDGSFALSGMPAPPYYTSAYRGPRLVLQEDGRVILNDLYRFSRLLPNGAFDATFSLGDVATVGVPVTESRGVQVMLIQDDGSMLLADEVFSVGGLTRRGLLRFVDRAAAMITTQPLDQTLTIGETLQLAVTVSGPGPFSYQWFKNGAAISGATSASFVRVGAAAADAGSYAVTVSNANGPVRSAAALIAIEPPVAPTITAQPRSQEVPAGYAVTLSVSASGSPAPTYQWLKDGSELTGATRASYTVAAMAAAQAGDYTVRVGNTGGSVVSNVARLSLLPAGLLATHAITSPALAAGGTVGVTNTFTFAGTPPALTWQVLLPAGWSLVSSSGDAAATRPAAGTVNLLEWSWSAVGTSPVSFGYVLQAPTAIGASAELAALVTARAGTDTHEMLARPDPLGLASQHSADTNRDFRLSLLELTRVIELYNTRNGTSRTGCYKVDVTGEDGFGAEPTRTSSAVVTLAKYHSADSNHDGKLSLLELTRVIELYNTRTGTTRTGQYHMQDGTEDGFAGGP